VLSTALAGASRLGRADVLTSIAPTIAQLGRELEAERLGRADVTTLEQARARRKR
jgi:hypothetical protein